jgi:hypothetical protein
VVFQEGFTESLHPQKFAEIFCTISHLFLLSRLGERICLFDDLRSYASQKNSLVKNKMVGSVINE